MKIQTLLIFVAGILLLPMKIFAVEGDLGCDPKTYSCYQKKVQDVCLKEGPERPWTSGIDLGALAPPGSAKCTYEPYTPDGLNGMINCMEQLERTDVTGFKDGVNPERIGKFGGYKSVEIARLIYRKNMDRIFACGVIASRYAKLEALENTINGGGISDITESIRKEKDRYENLRGQMGCDLNKPEKSSTGVVDRLMRSSMKEYCQYTYYLDYLDANVREDFTNTSRTETQVGEGNTSTLPTNTDAALRDITSRTSSIDTERMRARDVLPKVIHSFQEMDRTYIVHVMLVFIYDDYLKLRDNLGQYMALVGQTFEKAFNAQDANKK